MYKSIKDTVLRNAKPKEAPYTITIGEGLGLEIRQGKRKVGKSWVFRYQWQGKPQRMGLGVYPAVTLKQATVLRDELNEKIANGINPAQEKRLAKEANATGDTFEEVAKAWHKANLNQWTEGHGKAIMTRLEQNVFPFMGSDKLDSIKPPLILKVLQRIEHRGALDMLQRVKSIISQVLRYGVAHGLCERDFTQDLRGAFASPTKRHFPTITDPKRVGQLMRDIDHLEAQPSTYYAMKLAPFVFARPGNLRKAEWKEFDFKKKEWRIPAEKMKVKVQHIVPLSKQALAILEELKAITGHRPDDTYLFPCLRSRQRPLSDAALTVALRRMGYTKDELVVHGFRAMASTLLNENGWEPDVIERQLAHAERNSVRAAYNHAEYLPKRREMMDWWGDYLEELKG